MKVSTIKRQSRILVAATVATAFLTLMFVTLSGLSVAEARGPASEVAGDPNALQGSDAITLYLPILFKPSNLVFYDDFSDTDSGWPHKVDFFGCYMRYYNGRYRVSVSPDFDDPCIIKNYKVPVQPNGTFSVRVRRVSEKDRELFYGLVFGAGEVAAGEHADRWALEVYPNKEEHECDGKKPLFWLVALVDGKRKFFKTTCTDAIDRDQNDWNELKVIRDGKHIKVYINGSLKAEYTNANYLLNEGNILIEVISASDETVTVEFDNLRIERSTDAP